MLRTIALAAVLLAGPAAAQERSSQPQQQSDEEAKGETPKREPSKAPQQEEGASVTQPHARAEAATLTGRIVSTDVDRLTIVAPDGMRDIQLTGRTEVRGEGRTSTSQLRRGDEVRVSFDPKEGISVAKRIEVRSTGSRGEAVLTPPPGSNTPPGSTTTPGTATQGGGTTAPGGDTRR